MVYCYDFNAYTQLTNIKADGGNVYDKVKLTYVKPLSDWFGATKNNNIFFISSLI